MKPHPKLRKTIKWGGAALTVLLVVVWIGSMWWGVLLPLSSADTLAIEAGSASIQHAPRMVSLIAPDGWILARTSEPFHFKPSWESVPPTWKLDIPLWFLALPASTTAAAAWHLDARAHRRARLNLCPTGGCNYDRTGLAGDAVCPECGASAVGP